MKQDLHVGDKVVAISDNLHELSPLLYPVAGTIGIVIEVIDRDTWDKNVLVEWPKGTTAYDSRWWCCSYNVKKVEE